MSIPSPQEFFKGEPDHPLYPLPTMAQLEAVVSAKGAAGIREILNFRRDAIRRGIENPLEAARPKAWRVADRLRSGKDTRLMVLLGGNRSGKSWYCADALMRSALRAVAHNKARGHTGVTLFLVGSDSEANSKLITQALVWHFLPAAYKAENHKRGKAQRGVDIDINYSAADGFADRTLSLGWGVVISFILYSNDPANYEGAEFGAKDYKDVAWWMDEDLPLTWFTMLRRRGRYRPGIGLWSFTPILGMTPTIKEATRGRVRRTRVANLLPQDIVLVPGLPKGRVPFVTEGSDAGIKVVYFHSDLTPFGSGGQRYADTVAADCAGRPTDYTLRIYYGVTQDITGRAYPKYSRDVHWISVEHLPWEGCNYCFIDPADRNWFVVWVRAARGTPRRLFIYRDWPDKRRYDAWAVPSSRKITADSRRGLDGDPGPAQRSQGWGVPRYKRMMLAEETILLRLGTDGRIAERDPHRRHTANRALTSAGFEPIKTWTGWAGMPECAWSMSVIEAYQAEYPEPIREHVRVRKIDPRAAANPQQGQMGRITLLDLFHQEDKSAQGTIEAPRMTILPAYSGRGIDDGIAHVNELLDYDERQPLCPVINEPRLYVADCCEQVDWMFTNYTGEGGEDGACKDPADLVRYLAQDDDVRYLEPGGKLKTGGFKEGW